MRPDPDGSPGGFPFMEETYRHSEVRRATWAVEDAMLADTMSEGFRLLNERKTLAHYSVEPVGPALEFPTDPPTRRSRRSDSYAYQNPGALL